MGGKCTKLNWCMVYVSDIENNTSRLFWYEGALYVRAMHYHVCHRWSNLHTSTLPYLVLSPRTLSEMPRSSCTLSEMNSYLISNSLTTRFWPTYLSILKQDQWVTSICQDGHGPELQTAAWHLTSIEMNHGPWQPKVAKRKILKKTIKVMSWYL